MRLTRRKTPTQRLVKQVDKIVHTPSMRAGLAVVGGLVSATAASAVTSVIRNPRTKK